MTLNTTINVCILFIYIYYSILYTFHSYRFTLSEMHFWLEGVRICLWVNYFTPLYVGWRRHTPINASLLYYIYPLNDVTLCIFTLHCNMYLQSLVFFSELSMNRVCSQYHTTFWLLTPTFPIHFLISKGSTIVIYSLYSKQTSRYSSPTLHRQYLPLQPH